MKIACPATRYEEWIVDPEEAQLLLENHENYRSLTKGRVDAYSREMLAGNWKYSTLYFDTRGELCDGQHRLAAVVRCGIPQRFGVVFGLTRDDVKGIDSGQNRTRGQALRAEVGAVPWAQQVMSLCVCIENPKNAGVIVNSEALRYHERYKDLAHELVNAVHKQKHLRSSVYLTAFARAILCRPQQKHLILEALSRICQLQFSEGRDSALRLYYRLTMNKSLSGGGATVRWHLYLKCARAIDAFLNDESLGNLQAPKRDPFPWNPKESAAPAKSAASLLKLA